MELSVICFNLLLKGELEQIAQGLVQLGFENLQGWRLYNLYEQPVLLFDCSHSKNVFPYV